jgi:hypothetical protein
MKKIYSIFCVLLIMLFASVGFAAEVTETVEFEWDQEDTTNLKDWRLYWADVAGGPYATDPVVIIPFDGSAGPTYSGPASATVTGNQGTHVTKYFVLVACGDIPQEDGTTQYLCSDNSNEVNYAFWIPAGQFSVPIQFRIVANP